GAVRDLQKTAGTHLQAIAAELRQLSRDVAALAAMPLNAGKQAAEADTEHPLGGTPAAKDSGKDAAKDRLPANLGHQVARLKDDDAGNRFEAVDQLIRSKNPRVREHLLPMLKDPDLFVRRLTAEGLGDFKHAESVDALIVALADPESIVRHTAYTSLKKLTGQKIAFDPDASASSRNSAQRKWKTWWSKAKADF
ncbi:MAG: HEAT repeat domain-containing protein, partial [Planctomycetota bacterium]